MTSRGRGDVMGNGITVNDVTENGVTENDVMESTSPGPQNRDREVGYRVRRIGSAR